MQEKRNRMRVKFTTTVDVSTETQRVVSTGSRDISLKGIFVLTKETLPEGSACKVAIDLTGGSSECGFEAEGRVVRRTEEGLAIEFTSMAIDSFFHLRNMVLYNTTDPDGFVIECQEKPGFQ